MWEVFQNVMGIIVLLFGLGGGAMALTYSQEGARSSEFATGILIAGVAWAGAMAYIAYRLFGFH